MASFAGVLVEFGACALRRPLADPRAMHSCRHGRNGVLDGVLRIALVPLPLKLPDLCQAGESALSWLGSREAFEGRRVSVGSLSGRDDLLAVVLSLTAQALPNDARTGEVVMRSVVGSILRASTIFSG